MDGEALIRNAAKDRMNAGEVALGLIVRLARSGEIARIAKMTGHEFIFIDAQHALFSLETIGHIAQTAIGCGVTPIVRIRSFDDPDTPRLLDSGVMGIVVPDVDTAEQARRAVEICKFAPLGKRSVSGAYSILDFRPEPLDDTIRLLNDTTLVVCMIETREGLENMDEIAAVDGVDVLHIGCNDLLVELGKPGAFGCPEIMHAISRLIVTCRRHGKFAGLGGDKDLERQGRMIRDGIRFVTTQSDIAYLSAAASRRTQALRGAAASA
jgi:2-keto-3-deoxy-L-rhamnonate aldolase RhmA